MAEPRAPYVALGLCQMTDDAEILSFKIDAWTPETIPLGRLADYMRQLAFLYGETGSVHFHGLRKGSAVIQSRIEHDAVPKVLGRLQLVKSASRQTETSKAFDAIDEMLRKDNAVGTISRPKGGKILEFPGRKAAPPEVFSITQHTQVDGIVVRIGGIDETIPLVLQDREGKTSSCTIRGRDRAREMAKHLFGAPIRVSGLGKWTRNAEGAWELENLNVATVEELDDQTLEEAFNDVRRAAAGAWNSDSLEAWKHERGN